MAGASSTIESLCGKRAIFLQSIALFIFLWSSMVLTVHDEAQTSAALNLTLSPRTPTKALLNLPVHKALLERPYIPVSHLLKFATSAGPDPDISLAAPCNVNSENFMISKNQNVCLDATKMACSKRSPESRLKEGFPSTHLSHGTLFSWLRVLLGSLTSFSVNSSLGRSLYSHGLNVSPGRLIHRLHNYRTIELFDASVKVSSMNVIFSEIIDDREHAVENVGQTGLSPGLWVATNHTTLDHLSNSLENPQLSDVSSQSQSTELELGSNSARGRTPSLPEDLLDCCGPDHSSNRSDGFAPPNLKNVAGAYLDCSDYSFNRIIPVFVGNVPESQRFDLRNNSAKSFKLFPGFFHGHLKEFKAVGSAHLCHNATTLPPKMAEGLAPYDVNNLIGGAFVPRPPHPASSPTEHPLAPAPGPAAEKKLSKIMRTVVLVLSTLLIVSFVCSTAVIAYNQFRRKGVRDDRVHNHPSDTEG